MLGVVFTEFVECMENNFGLSVADRVQGSCPFQTAFTSVGYYDHNSLLTMVGHLQQETGKPPAELVRSFGRHIFHSFVRNKPEAFEGVSSTPELLLKVQETIHSEVRCLYPMAELPQFRFPEAAANEFRFEYCSTRPLADLAQGMLDASVEYFNESWQIDRFDLEGPAGTHALFVFTMQ